MRSSAFQQELWREVYYGEYVAKCRCCKSFRTCPSDIEPKAKYDNQVRQAVLDRILVDKLNAATVQQAMQRDFLLKLSTGFLYDCLEDAIRKYDGAEFRAQVLSQFSGTLCVDEIHLGQRPSKRMRARVKQRKQQREQADRLFRRRHLLVTKKSNLTQDDRSVLDELLSLSPTLGVLRSFVDDLHELFAIRRSKDQAWKIWRRMRRNPSYGNNEHLCKALAVLSKDNLAKLLSYLDHPSSARSQVRTNNHVERCNRVLRYLEKVRYKWRRRRTIVRHLLLQFANWMKRKESNPALAY